MIPPCLTPSNIRYVSRRKWSNPGKGVAPALTPRCSSYWKGSLLVALDYGRQLYLLTLHGKSQEFRNCFFCIGSYYLIEFIYSYDSKGRPFVVVVNVPDCDTVMNEVELQSRYYVYFRTNTHGKGMNPLFLPAMG